MWSSSLSTVPAHAEAGPTFECITRMTRLHRHNPCVPCGAAQRVNHCNSARQWQKVKERRKTLKVAQGRKTRSGPSPAPRLQARAARQQLQQMPRSRSCKLSAEQLASRYHHPSTSRCAAHKHRLTACMSMDACPAFDMCSRLGPADDVERARYAMAAGVCHALITE